MKRFSKKQKQEKAETKKTEKSLKPADIQMTVTDNRGKKKSANREYDAITIKTKGRNRQERRDIIVWVIFGPIYVH